MSGVIDNFVATGGTSGANNAPNSRYAALDTQTYTAPDGTVIRYLQRRIIPQPEQYALQRRYVVVQGDRIDNVAYKQLGDPLLFWILCDANAAMDPEELTSQVGRSIGITLPAGVALTGRSG